MSKKKVSHQDLNFPTGFPHWRRYAAKPLCASVSVPILLKLLSEYNYALEFYANGALSRVIIVQKLKPQAFTVLGWNANDIALAQASSLALCIVCLFLAHHSYA